MLTGSTNEEKIWNYLYAQLGNAYGTAGIMGNIKAESNLEPKNLQNTYEKKLGYTDETYTVAVDNGTYTNFIKDSAGYGLVQWTYWSLKRDLYNYVKEQNGSIGDLELQLAFLCKQLKESYNASVWQVAKNATSILEASNAMLLKFERPADQSLTVQNKRASFGETFYNKYAITKNITEKEENNTVSIMICHASIDENGSAKNGAAGDQTGKEVCIRAWYSKPWSVMLRYSDSTIANKAAAIAMKLAKSNLVGYDQNQRNTLYAQLKANSFDVDKYIKSGVKTETDCSAFVYACYACVLPAIRQDSNAPTTSTMRNFFTNHGFNVYTSSSYLTSINNLKSGDLLVKPGSHTAMAVNTSSSSISTTVTNTTTTSTTTSNTINVYKDTTSTSNINYTAKVTATELNCRIGNATSCAIVKTYKKGEIVNITDEINGWGYTGEGWVYLQYIQKISTTTTASSSYKVKITAGALNCRKGPATSYAIVKAYTNGEIVTIQKTKNSWGYTGEGWISLKYTQKV